MNHMGFLPGFPMISGNHHGNPGEIHLRHYAARTLPGSRWSQRFAEGSQVAWHPQAMMASRGHGCGGRSHPKDSSALHQGHQVTSHNTVEAQL